MARLNKYHEDGVTDEDGFDFDEGDMGGWVPSLPPLFMAQMAQLCPCCRPHSHAHAAHLTSRVPSLNGRLFEALFRGMMGVHVMGVGRGGIPAFSFFEDLFVADHDPYHGCVAERLLLRDALTKAIRVFLAAGTTAATLRPKTIYSAGRPSRAWAGWVAASE